MSASRGRTRFSVGDRVQVIFGSKTVNGVILEDRGAIGVRGRHLFRVEVAMEPEESVAIEVPDSEIQSAPAEERVPPSKEQIIEYLRSGGLVSILRANTGGRNQPKAWLCFDNLGNVTHTFVEARGIIGGQPIPFLALQEDKVFAPERKAVLSYLTGFGLSDREARAVIEKIGTSPT